MKSISARGRRRMVAVLKWCGAAGAIAAVILAYRWAEPSPDALNAAHTIGGATASIHLQDTPFAGYVDGARTWSIFAGQVDLLRLPNAALTSIQSASITDIRNGTLYEPPRHVPGMPGTVTTRVMEAGAAAVNSGPIAATFHAKHGHYSLGMLEVAPPDLDMLYTVQWQFKLSGDVEFRTRGTDVFSAPAMTIYSLVNRRSGRSEQRVTCDEGGKMTHRGIEITANSIRFNPKDRTVECLSGVRGTYKGGNVQAERVFWSLNDETLRCPESATGTIQGMPFIAEGLTLDIKRRKHHATHMHIVLDPMALRDFKE